MGARRNEQPRRRIVFEDGSWINNVEYQRYRRARRQRWLNLYKTNKGCELCGYKAHGVALDFDHLNPSEKEFNPSSRSMNIKLKGYLTRLESVEFYVLIVIESKHIKFNLKVTEDITHK